MPLTLSDEHIRISLMTTKPANWPVVTVAEANAGIRAECAILKSDYKLGSTGTQKIGDLAVCEPSGSERNGARMFEGQQMTPFIYLDNTGKPATAENAVWDMLKDPETKIWVVESEGVDDNEDFAAGEMYDSYEVTTGAATKPQDRYAGYVKRTVPLTVKGEENLIFAA